MISPISKTSIRAGWTMMQVNRSRISIYGFFLCHSYLNNNNFLLRLTWPSVCVGCIILIDRKNKSWHNILTVDRIITRFRLITHTLENSFLLLKKRIYHRQLTMPKQKKVDRYLAPLTMYRRKKKYSAKKSSF
jgi:hypothetical protein